MKRVLSVITRGYVIVRVKEEVPQTVYRSNSLAAIFVVNLKLSSVPLALKQIPGKYIKEDP